MFNSDIEQLTKVGKSVMFDQELLMKSIREKINEKYELGDHAGGSGHLPHRSLSKLTLSEPIEITHEGKKAFEVICEYKIFTETEFEYDPDDYDDWLTERHKDKVIVDKNLTVLDFIELR